MNKNNIINLQNIKNANNNKTTIIEDRISILHDINMLKYYFINELGIKKDHINFLIEQSDEKALSKLRELYYEVIKFDLVNGTQTSSYITEDTMQYIAKRDSSQFANLDNVFHGVKYRASLTSIVKSAFNHSQKILRDNGISLKDVSAFDIGCGAGKPLLLAIKDLGFGFKKAIGIDYFRKMIRLANKNAHIMGLSDKIDFIFTDASQFIEYDDVNLIYMYNPFDETIMKEVERNIRKYGGKTIVAYNKPMCAHLFSQKNGWKLEFEQNSSDPDNTLKIFSYGL